MTAAGSSAPLRPFDERTIEVGLRTLGSGIPALDREVERLDAHLRGLPPEGWASPTRCSEWSVKDVVAHLASGELYNEACIEDRIDSLGEWADDEEYNIVHVERRRHLAPADVYAEWRARHERVRAAWGRLDTAEPIVTQIGPYPVDLQAWHIASEYATHADDVGVPVPPEERAARREWRYAFSRYAVTERAKPHEVERSGDVVVVVRDGVSTRLDVDGFVAAVSARLAVERFPAAERASLLDLRSLV